ncbi:MAG TPA: serine/threonine-protein kinase [Kofleriaceae bacterium]|nr:serine/threonine-protein kinase [Kofleriaceae bacterium]
MSSGRKPDDTDPAIAATEPEPLEIAPVGAEGSAAAAQARGPRPIRPGDVLGRYEIGDELGEGGMATVFRARDRELRRDVAVKVLFPHLARRAEVVRRFHREARAAAGLEHANILRIYDVGGNEPSSDPGARGELDPPYIVMELIRGRTLLQEVEQRGPLLAELVACIGALLADALVAAHAAGIIHRDIKPSNVLLAQGGRLLLADFGVARLETEDSLVTRTGALLGTPAYMSPEQASGDTATARSDLYSLGATLYQLSTGHLPYSGSPAKVMAAVAAGQLVAPVRRRASVGPELSAAIEHMMAVEIDARPRSAAAVAAELRRIAADGGLGDPAEELAAYGADPEGFLRARAPLVVAAIRRAAARAIEEQRLPRALALADRASALLPDDPEVAALVERVTEGGRARSRRRAVALAGAGLVLAGGAAAGAIAMVGRSGEPAAGAGGSAAAAGGDAALAGGDAAIAGAEPAAVGGAAAADAPVVVDAGIGAGIARRPRDRTGSAALASAIDAALGESAAPAPADAQPAVALPAIDAAPPALATLQIKNDLWCNLTIDGEDHGRLTQSKTVRLPPGRHVVRCEQPSTALRWQRDVDLLPGQTFVIDEAMIREVELVVATPGDRVMIDGAPAARGATVRLRPGQHRVIVLRGDKELTAGWVTVPRARTCRLRDADGKLVCDP